MKRSILTLAAVAALTLGGASAAQAKTVCEVIPVPAVPAVYDTIVTPAVTVVEYEFTHRPGDLNGNGQGPANRWEEDPNWNAESNPASVGWVATGAVRTRIVTPESADVVLVSPEIPATTVEQCLELPDGVSPVPVGAPEVPLGNLDPAPAPVEAAAPVEPVAPARVVPPQSAAAPLADVGQPVAATTPAPSELAYTGAADWVLPAGLLTLTLGGAAVVLSRRIVTNK